MLTERQKEIIQAAMNIIVSEGTYKLTIRNVAAVIGVTEPAVYRHFTSKHDLLVSLLEHLQQSIVTVIRQMDAEQEPFTRFTQKFLSALFARIESNPAFALFVFTEEAFHADAALRPLLAGMLAEITGLLQQIISRYQAVGQCRADLSSDDIALIILGTIRLSVTRWHLSDGSPPLTDEADSQTALFCSLFRA
jgi:AcrR family transcriptional regulator